MNRVHDVYFHAWHFVFNQVQLDNWFGNIVAGIVSFAALSLLWPRLRRAISKFVREHVSAGNAELHAKLDHIIKHSPDIPDLPVADSTTDEGAQASKGSRSARRTFIGAWRRAFGLSSSRDARSRAEQSRDRGSDSRNKGEAS